MISKKKIDSYNHLFIKKVQKNNFLKKQFKTVKTVEFLLIAYKQAIVTFMQNSLYAF
jgi:hypothetical protein